VIIISEKEEYLDRMLFIEIRDKMEDFLALGRKNETIIKDRMII
jgi:hypothetical protein